LFFAFNLEYAIKRVQLKDDGMKLNVKYQLWIILLFWAKNKMTCNSLRIKMIVVTYMFEMQHNIFKKCKIPAINP